MAIRFPQSQGFATDYGGRPPALASFQQVEWFSCDANAPDFTRQLGGPYDLIFANNVWEHVLYPHAFAASLLKCLAPLGTLLLVTPNYGSIARRILGGRWPFWLPGEHLNVPTIAGATQCLKHAVEQALGDHQATDVRASAISVPYNLAYTLATLGLERLSTHCGTHSYVPLPIGILEAVVSLR